MQRGQLGTERAVSEMQEDDLVVIYGKEDWSRVTHSGVLTIQFMDEDCTMYDTPL